MITIRDLTKSFVDGGQRKAILKGLSLSVPAGQSVAITGESGCGKSTLLNVLASLDTPDEGSIIVNDEEITEFTETQADHYRRQAIGIVFQQYNLIDCLNVNENVTLSARLNQNLDKAYIQVLMQRLGIDDLIDKMPWQLSGGEQQRVAIARSLAHKPVLILADEPTGNLDDKNSDQVAELLYSLCDFRQTSLVMVTHSQRLAKQAHTHYQLADGIMSEQPC